MIRILLVLVLLFVNGLNLSSQTLGKVLGKADSLYHAKDFKQSLMTYEEAMLFEKNDVRKIIYYNAACCASLVNDSDKAYKYLKKAIDLGYFNIHHIQHDSDFNNIKHKRRFKKILKKLKKRNDRNKSLKFTVRHIPNETNPLSLEELKKIYKEDFYLAGIGYTNIDKHESYTYLLEDVLVRLRKKRGVRDKVKKVFIDYDFEALKEMEAVFKEYSDLLVLVNSMYITDYGSTSREVEIFNIHFIKNRKILHLIELKITGNMQAICSKRYSKKFKKMLYKELLTVLKE